MQGLVKNKSKENDFACFLVTRGACRRWHNSNTMNVKLVFFCFTANDKLSCASLQKIFHGNVFPGFDSLITVVKRIQKVLPQAH
jgi:hypothetical protein